MKPHKILITGTFESGKTDLTRLFVGDPRIIIVPEIAREMIAHDPSIQSKPEFQDLLFSQQLKNEALAEASCKPIILCDRGVLDIVAFSSALGIPVKKEWLINSLGRYRSIIICNAGDIPYSVGNGQLDTRSFRDQVDTKIRQIVNEIAEADQTRPTIEEVRGTLEERKVFLNRHVDTTMSLREGRGLRREQDL